MYQRFAQAKADGPISRPVLWRMLVTGVLLAGLPFLALADRAGIVNPVDDIHRQLRSL